MVGFCGILGIDEAKYHLTIKDRLLDGKIL